MFKSVNIKLEECEEDITVSEDVPVIPSFKKMGLNTDLLHGIYEYGFEKPSLVQQRAIAQIIQGRDVVVQAQSGTGKTATFCIGSLQRVDSTKKETQALFLAPTRELASQIHQVITALADYLSVKCVLCCGGKGNVGEMTKSVGQGSHIVVGTPGRILELLRHGCLKLARLRVVVVDEADEMLNQGLREQLEQIFKRLPVSTSSSADLDYLENAIVKSPVQRVVVSATWTSGCREMMQQFLDNPVRILVPRDELTVSGIEQFYIDSGGEEWKFETLADVFSRVCVPQTVVFVNTRRKVDWLTERLRRDGFAVTAAHGDTEQSERDRIMSQFRAGRSRILVTTDIWARGIDVQAVGLVVNYDLPQTAAVYLHRIGRSGRFGRRGLAISLSASPADRSHLTNIAKTYSIAISPAPANLADLTETQPTKELGVMPKPASIKKPPSLPKKKAEAKVEAYSEICGTEAMSAAKKRKVKLKKNKEKRRKLAEKKKTNKDQETGVA